MRRVSSEPENSGKITSDDANDALWRSPAANMVRRFPGQKRAAECPQPNEWGMACPEPGISPLVGILIIAPRLLVREGIARILVPEKFSILASVSKISELSPSSIGRHQSLLLIIDASDDMEAAIEQIRQFRCRFSAGRVAVLNDRSQPNEMVSALRAGANAYLSNVENLEVFIKSLEVVMLGETLLWRGSLSYILERPTVLTPNNARTLRLSEQERDILRCLAKGATNRAIASDMDVDLSTAKRHVRGVLQKIRARNRTQAAMWALKQWDCLQGK